MKILLVEDDLTSRMFMEKYLSRYGHVSYASNGLLAIDLVEDALKKNQYYDLICLDVMMPKIDGLKTLKEIKKLEKKYPDRSMSKVIMTSALNDKHTVEEAYDSGCHGYAWKPIDIQKFDELLKTLNLID
ncbi:response regulator [Acidaminobacter sp. JC074]|uniref:response regulator n=1 Tax=Acidaminobacter sp. JC074 TaxID=2530199 RepID=UPI001F10DC56|nr:response regulator [Acidaminobacter sp. JC074]MCH4890795.1 response regulator [Acidaminobacter sp. JC074]